MTNEMQFKTIVAQYCEVKPEDIKNDFARIWGSVPLISCLFWESLKIRLT